MCIVFVINLMIYCRFLNQSEGLKFRDRMLEFREALQMADDFSILIDIENKAKRNLYEEQFLPRIRNWNNENDNFKPTSYTHLKHLPCLLILVDKGRDLMYLT